MTYFIIFISIILNRNYIICYITFVKIVLEVIVLTLAIFNKLANWGNLTPLTNNPNEWMKLGGSTDEFWQNRRKSSCFSKDLKFYYDLDEKENYNWDKDGGKTFKPRSEWIYHELKEYK